MRIYPRLNICHIQNALNHCPGEEHWREYDGVWGGVLRGVAGACNEPRSARIPKLGRSKPAQAYDGIRNDAAPDVE